MAKNTKSRSAVGPLSSLRGSREPAAVTYFPVSNRNRLSAIWQCWNYCVEYAVTRSTFRDWAGDRTHYPREVIEHALAHRIKDKAEASYRRGDALEKRRLLMNEWAKYCSSPAVISKVVSLR